MCSTSSFVTSPQPSCCAMLTPHASFARYQGQDRKMSLSWHLSAMRRSARRPGGPPRLVRRAHASFVVAVEMLTERDVLGSQRLRSFQTPVSGFLGAAGMRALMRAGLAEPDGHATGRGVSRPHPAPDSQLLIETRGRHIRRTKPESGPVAPRLDLCAERERVVRTGSEHIPAIAVPLRPRGLVTKLAKPFRPVLLLVGGPGYHPLPPVTLSR